MTSTGLGIRSRRWLVEAPQVPADEVPDERGSVRVVGRSGRTELLPEFGVDAPYSSERVLVLVGHGSSIAGWLTTGKSQVVDHPDGPCHTWVVNHPGTVQGDGMSKLNKQEKADLAERADTQSVEQIATDGNQSAEDRQIAQAELDRRS